MLVESSWWRKVELCWSSPVIQIGFTRHNKSRNLCKAHDQAILKKQHNGNNKMKLRPRCLSSEPGNYQLDSFYLLGNRLYLMIPHVMK